MEKSRLETKVGLFVVLGLALLATLLILFSKGASPFSRTYELRLHASNVGGLKERAGVLLAGVQVGGVSSIQLAEDGKSVTILLSIYQGCKIYRDARFIIEQSGFLGDQYVSIIPTENKDRLLATGDEVNCQEPFDLQEVARSASGFIKRIEDTAKKLDDSVTDLRRVVLNEQTLTNFSATMHNLRTVSEQAMDTVNNINALVATNGSQINLAVGNVAFFSQELLRLAGSAEGVLATNSADITAAVKNIESSTEVLKDLLNNVQSGKGLAGTILENDQLTTNVQAIANNLAIASSNLNRLGLWHFLWHKEPVRTPPGGTTATNAPR
jgi:phospholipid/cholesterol/gamma-HCH transport system substrate-binding protein